MNKWLLTFLMIMSAGCTNSSDAKKALESEGFSNIQTQGYGWFACSKDDTFSTKFTAVNSQGKKVSGVVCSGLLFKNSTIRW